MAPDSGNPAQGPQGTVLVVDDDPQIGAIVRVVLRRAGYECLIAHDGDTAWKLLSPAVTLVLLDVMMPGQNGPEILWRMRRDPAVAHIPVIFVTGRSDASTRIQCIAMGAADFVVKPFKPKELIEKIHLAVERGGPRDLLDEEPTQSGDDPLDRALEVESGAAGDGEPGAREGSALVGSTLVKSLLAERRATRHALDAHSRLFSALFRLHQAMGSGLELAAIGDVVVSLAQKALRAEGATLWLPAGRGLHRLAARGMDGSEAVDLAENAPPAQAWRDWLTVERSPAGGELELHQPLTAGAERVGVLSLRFPAAHAPSESLASFFAAEVALALDSALRFDRARSEAVTDALTGAYNRRFLEKRFADELQRARSLATPLSLMFVDIDHFKNFNDLYGHDVGDRVLCETASLLRRVLRNVDVVARYGGDEFVVVLPETDRDGSSVVAKVIREAVARLAAESGPELRSLTVTIGAASFPEDGASAAEMLAVADAAMLRGKRAGRDRIELFGGEAARAADGVAARDDQRLAAAVLRSLLYALDLRDPGTGSHSRAVAALSARVARRLGCSPEEVRTTAQAGLLHDVGKLHTPDRVLLKPGPLDLEERAIMDRHAELGASLTEALPELRALAPIVRACQEHWDGGGYPLGMAGSAIPRAARIISVADAFHAMTSDRPYRRALSVEAAAAELRRCAGTQFEPEAVAALLAVVGAPVLAKALEPVPRVASAA